MASGAYTSETAFGQSNMTINGDQLTIRPCTSYASRTPLDQETASSQAVAHQVDELIELSKLAENPSQPSDDNSRIRTDEESGFSVDIQAKTNAEYHSSTYLCLLHVQG